MPGLGGEPPREGADTSQHAAHEDPAPAGARTDAASGPRRKTPRLTHDGYRHEAFFWDGDEEFVCGTVPFIREGLAAGQPVMV
ncbi:MAG: hypothetical protein WB473_06025, partial [Pedococcus sp.]